LEDVKAKYIEMAKVHHPDRNESGCHKEFSLMTEAYNVLSEKKSKSQFDNFISNSERAMDIKMYQQFTSEGRAMNQNTTK